jgi:hypothetical protein
MPVDSVQVEDTLQWLKKANNDLRTTEHEIVNPNPEANTSKFLSVV